MARGRPGQGTLAVSRGECFPAVFPFLGGEWWQREQGSKQGCFQKGRDKWGKREGFGLGCGWRDGGLIPSCPSLARHLTMHTSPTLPGGTGTHWAYRHCQLSLPSII